MTGPDRLTAAEAAHASLDRILDAQPAYATLPAARPAPARQPRSRVTEAQIVRVLALTPGPPVRVWIALAWSGLTAAEIAALRRKDLRARPGGPVADVGRRIVRLLPLTVRVLAAEDAAGEMHREGLITGLDRAPDPARVISVACNSWLRRGGVAATLRQIARQQGNLP